MNGQDQDHSSLPSITEKSVLDNAIPLAKPLFKLKIEDLLKIPFNEERNTFIFKNKEVNLIMFGGKIANISRDDSIFSFDVTSENDDANVIRCYHKYDRPVDFLINQVNEFFDLAPKSNAVNDISDCDEQDELDNSDEDHDDAAYRNIDDKWEETISEILLWFKKQVVATKKENEIGEAVHVSGYLSESDSIRKVNVVDFRIVNNEEEHDDFKFEVDFLYKHVY